MRAPTAADRGAVAAHPGPVLLAASMLWAGAGLIIRAAPAEGPLLALWRCLLGAIAYQSVLALRARRLSMRDLSTASVGGLGFGLSVVCLFVAYRSTTLVSANVIGCLQPIALGFVAHRSTGRLDRVEWGATAAAAMGTLIVVVGSSTHTGTWSLRGDLFALAGTAANVMYVIGTKRARESQGALQYQAAMLWVAAAVIVPIAVVAPPATMVPAADGWPFVVALVVIGGSGHLLFSAAQRHVSVAASSSILLAEVLAVSVGAAILFDQPITAVQAVGMSVVASSIAVWVRHTAGAGTGASPPGAVEPLQADI